ncbi:MAG: galactokinase [Flammeovirgaceae bacterium]
MKTPKDFPPIFNKVYGKKGTLAVYFAPGRVNLIGEHLDYNGGYVLPCALQNLGIFLGLQENHENVFRFSSTSYNDQFEIPFEQLSQAKVDQSWVNYPLGVIHQFQKEGIELKGFDLLFSGNIPQGAGLSSSAAIELVTAFALNELCNAKFDLLDLVKLSQQAEQTFVGVNCGIMDQFAVAYGKKDQAILLKCDSLDWKHIPIHLNGNALVLAHTNYPRKLTDSKYNERRAECEKAVAILKPTFNIDYLAELEIARSQEALKLIRDETIHKRAKHVFEENHRVMISRVALKNDDLSVFGRLMNASHYSLSNDYEVTGKHLDALAHAAQTFNGTLGARMTGAGFGGCTVNLVKRAELDTFKNLVGQHYTEQTGLEASFYEVEVGDGVRFLEHIQMN